MVARGEQTLEISGFYVRVWEGNGKGKKGLASWEGQGGRRELIESALIYFLPFTGRTHKSEDKHQEKTAFPNVTVFSFQNKPLHSI